MKAGVRDSRAFHHLASGLRVGVDERDRSAAGKFRLHGDVAGKRRLARAALLRGEHEDAHGGRREWRHRTALLTLGLRDGRKGDEAP